MKKIIIYQSSICAYGGVESFLYNWCWWLRNYFDVTVLYCNGDATRIGKMKKIVKLEKYEPNKTYKCDIFIRNSVWGTIPQHIKAEQQEDREPIEALSVRVGKGGHDPTPFSFFQLRNSFRN